MPSLSSEYLGKGGKGFMAAPNLPEKKRDGPMSVKKRRPPVFWGRKKVNSTCHTSRRKEGGGQARHLRSEGKKERKTVNPLEELPRAPTPPARSAPSRWKETLCCRRKERGRCCRLLQSHASKEGYEACLARPKKTRSTHGEK